MVKSYDLLVLIVIEHINLTFENKVHSSANYSLFDDAHVGIKVVVAQRGKDLADKSIVSFEPEFIVKEDYVEEIVEWRQDELVWTGLWLGEVLFDQLHLHVLG